MPAYTPTEADLAWVTITLRLLNDGGIWICPGTTQLYRVSHKDKTMSLISSPRSDPDFTEKTRATFAAVGYTILDETPQVAN